jgi:hypothetical protein
MGAWQCSMAIAWHAECENFGTYEFSFDFSGCLYESQNLLPGRSQRHLDTWPARDATAHDVHIPGKQDYVNAVFAEQFLLPFCVGHRSVSDGCKHAHIATNHLVSRHLCACVALCVVCCVLCVVCGILRGDHGCYCLRIDVMCLTPRQRIRFGCRVKLIAVHALCDTGLQSMEPW